MSGLGKRIVALATVFGVASALGPVATAGAATYSVGDTSNQKSTSAKQNSAKKQATKKAWVRARSSLKDN